MKIVLCFFVLINLALPLPSYSASSVYLQSAGQNSAVLIIDGNEVVLTEGEDHDDVLLVKSGGRSALLEINGLRQRLNVNSSIKVGASYQQASNEPVVLKAQKNGHHWAQGKINGKPVKLLVDTGASRISMSRSSAKRLNVKGNGQKIMSNTANGLVESEAALIKRIVIGGIVQRNVAASILPDSSISVVLLGNSFLSRVDMRVDKGTMTLSPR